MRIAVVGGGILGLATARLIATSRRGDEVVLLEKEDALARHQTGHNSGVVHAGLYYAPGSLKARLCTRGRGLLREFCAEHGLAYDECCKLVVDRSGDELPALREIKQLLLATRDERSDDAESEAFARRLASEDGREGVAAFLEKRAPRWRTELKASD